MWSIRKLTQLCIVIYLVNVLCIVVYGYIMYLYYRVSGKIAGERVLDQKSRYRRHSVSTMIHVEKSSRSSQ